MSKKTEHGFIWEKEIITDKIVDVLKITKDEIEYTNKWDIPPISVKSFSMDSKNPGFGFGDIFRTVENKDNFILVLVGYSKNKNHKKVIFSDAIYVQDKYFSKAKKNLCIDELKSTLKEIKNINTVEDKRALGRKFGKYIRSKNDILKIAPKITSKGGARFQCTIEIQKLYDILNKDIVLTNKLNIKDIIE